jgi:DNA-binding NarL/FixJ family response regulator
MELLSDALRLDASLQVSALPSDPWELVHSPELGHAQVALMSATLDEDPGRAMSLVREVRMSYPALRIVVLLESSRRELIQDIFRAGARGVFSQHDSVEDLRKCIHAVYQGQIWANSEQTAFLLEAVCSSPSVHAVDAKGFNLLSKREQEVVQSLAEGLTNREIGSKLGLSQHTIKNYLFKIFDKVGVSSRLELLFLTLSQAPSPQSPGTPVCQPATESAATIALMWCQQAAEKGVTAAQIALAQICWEGELLPKDPVSAYKWYLISQQTGLALRQQINIAMPSILRSLNAEQRSKAEKYATDWLKKARLGSSIRDENIANACTEISA